MNVFLAVVVLPPLVIGFVTGLVFAPFRFGFVAGLDLFGDWAEKVERRRLTRKNLRR